MKTPIKTIGIIGPSSQIPAHELALGVRAIEAAGFRVRVHGQVKGSHWFFAGTDEQRFRAFVEYARDPEIDVLWCARGGYGSNRLLPLLEAETKRGGKPPRRKLLIGYSDTTALFEFTRQRWGWSTLHAPMPALRRFSVLPEREWQPLVEFVKGSMPERPWGKLALKFATARPERAVRGELVGGNLAVWNTLIGTKWMGSAKGKIVFFEDIDESLYRLDRMVHHLLNSGSLEGARAIVLGDFLNCRDTVPNVLGVEPKARTLARLIAKPRPTELKPLRARLDEKKLLPEIFAQLGDALGIPVAYGLPVGHGPNFSPLPLGAEYELTPRGGLEILNWHWTRDR